MAEDFINELYELADTITYLKRSIEKCNHQISPERGTTWSFFNESLKHFCESLLIENSTLAHQIWETAESICSRNTGTSALAGDLEVELLPLLYSAMSSFGNIDVTENNFRLLSTESGYLTIQDVSSRKFLHSTCDPMKEAYELAKYIYTPKCSEFHLFGLGLGYLAYQMWEVSEHSIDIYICEKCPELITYAELYGVLSRIPKEHVFFCPSQNDKDLFDFFTQRNEKRLTGESELFCMPWAKRYVGAEFQQPLTDYFVISTNSKDFSDSYARNFHRNLKNVKGFVSELKRIERHSEFALIAAGPSIDSQMNEINALADKMPIIAVSTVYKKLLSKNICPDYVISADPQERMYKHYEGVPATSATLIIADTAAWQIANRFVGEKYLVPHGSTSEIIQYFNDRNEELLSFGSTVTSMGIELAAYFNASKLHLYGVDLAYPGQKSHADGTMDQHEIQNGIFTEDVNGNPVMTDPTFLLYISEIESQLKRHPNMITVNHSPNGAKIKGTMRP